MKIQLIKAKKIIDLPTVIYLDQIMNIDLGFIEKMSTTDTTKLSEMQPLFKWFVDFLKAIDVKHRFTLSEFTELLQHEQFQPWLRNLFGDFQ